VIGRERGDHHRCGTGRMEAVFQVGPDERGVHSLGEHWLITHGHRFRFELEPGIPLIPPDLLRKRAEEIEHRATVSCGAEELAVGRLDGPDCVACELLAFARHAQLAGP